MKTVVEIDRFAVFTAQSPHYCRGIEDKVRWLAWSLGWLDTISPRDKVEDNPDRDSIIIRES